MCDKELIVGYLYGELSAAERQAFAAHLAGCADCRTEVEELGSTRRHLALWHPPQPDLGFRVIRGGGAPVEALPRRSRLATAFAFAAAAVVILAAGAAIANLEVRYGADGVTVRTGWARPAPADAADSRNVQLRGQAADGSFATSGDFAVLDKRLREIEAVLSVAPSDAVVQTAATGMSDAEMLRKVRQIVSEAEVRQQTAVTNRLLDVVRAVDIQRRADLANIQQGLGQYQGLTNAEIATNRDMLNQLVRAATRQEK